MMRLLEYQRNVELGLVEARFAEADGRVWHFQMLEACGGAGPRILYEEAEQPATMGALPSAAGGRDFGDTERLVVDGHWHELMLLALETPSGAEALVRSILF
jgi:hypothetical protein